MIKRYDSVAALRADYLRLDASPRTRRTFSETYGGMENAWYGGESEGMTLKLTETGNTNLVPAAERFFAQLETGIETPRRVWERAPAGAFVCVPDVLAGYPTPMRRTSHTSDETAPITILVVTTSSAGVEAPVLEKRGTVILALVMALSRIRPVTLHQITTLDGTHEGETIITAQINTSPLDLATACYVLTSAGFARRLTYNLARKLNNYRGGWPAGYSHFNPEPYRAKLPPKLGLDPRDTLLIPEAHLLDTLLTDPLGWINAQISKFTSQEEAQYA